MKTSTGVFILMAVAGILALILWWYSGNIDHSAVPTDDEQGLYQTLDLSDSCSSGEYSSCCDDDCPDFCKSQKMKSVKTFANNHLCTCWCEP